MLDVGLDYRPALLTSVGIGRYVRELTAALAETPGIALHLFGHSWQRPRRPDHPESASLHRLRLPGRALPALARLGIDASRLTGRPALFHWTDYVHPPVRRCPVILTIHDVAFADDPTSHGTAQSAELLARTRRAAAQAARILTPTRATADAVVRHLGVAEDRIAITPLGVDHVHAQIGERPAQPVPTDFTLVVGTIEPRKNHERILDAWQQIGRPPLVVVGRRGWECARAIDRLDRERQAGHLVWLEGTTDAELRWLLERARLLLYPSTGEGFGLPPLEAMAVGTPVVAGSNPACREVLADAAVWCDPLDTESIADAWCRVAEKSDTRSRLESAGRRRAEGFTWAESAVRTIAEYRIVTA